MNNILIVDDEHLIRKSLKNKIIKSNLNYQYTVEEASSFNEALEKLKIKRMDIVICDIQLGRFNGLDLIKKVRNKYPEIKFIIISGYSNFQYAQKAIEFSVISYLLKPINTIEFLTALNKCISLKKKEKVVEIKNTFNQLYLKNQELNSIILSKDLRNLNQICDFENNNKFLTFSLFTVDKNQDLFFIIFKILANNLYFKLYKNYIFYKKNPNQYIIIFFIEKFKTTDSFNEISLIQSSLLKYLSENNIIDFTLSISSLNNDIFQSVEESNIALKNRIQIMNNQIINYSDCAHLKNEYSLTIENQLKLKLFIKEEKTKQLKEHFINLKTIIEKGEISSTNLESLYQDYLKLINQEKVIKKIEFFNSINLMLDELESLFLYKDNIEKVSFIENIVENIKNEINCNFNNIIHLKDFEKKYNLNKSILSTAFKEIVGFTFQDYLSNVRIEKSKKLLLEEKLKILTISKICGFSTQYYFSKVFKEKTGYTPSEYRQQNSL